MAHAVLLVPSVPSLTLSGARCSGPSLKVVHLQHVQVGLQDACWDSRAPAFPLSHGCFHLHCHCQTWIHFSLQQRALKYQSPIKTIILVDSVLSMSPFQLGLFCNADVGR